MRTSKLAKKLTLNKITVSNLEPQQMNGLKGGIVPTFEDHCLTQLWHCTYFSCDPKLCERSYGCTY